MIVPSGGLSEDGRRWISSRPGFLMPVKALSPVPRALLAMLAEAHAQDRLRFFGDLAPHPWPAATAGQRLDALSVRPAVLRRPAARRCHPIPFPQCTTPGDRCCGRIPIKPAALPLTTKRDFVPWRFSDACRPRAQMAPSCRRPRNLHKSRNQRFERPPSAKTAMVIRGARLSSMLLRIARCLRRVGKVRKKRL
jgi:hypothetical protein